MTEHLEMIAERFSKSPSGCECTFVKLDNSFAAKVYTNKEECEKAYKQQLLAASHDLGPNAFCLMSIDCQGHELHFYLTEIVEVIGIIDKGPGYLVSERWLTSSEKLELKELQVKLSQIGIAKTTILDLYELNIGWKNGKMVAIDFGRS